MQIIGLRGIIYSHSDIEKTPFGRGSFKEGTHMKKFIKVILLMAVIIIILLLSFHYIGTGFIKRGDVALVDYSVSEDGSEITLYTSIWSSMGYTRGYKDLYGGGVKPHYLTFYSTFGGLNSSYGAKNEHVLPLGKDDSEIYFNRLDGGYELVLIKDKETGKWIRP